MSTTNTTLKAKVFSLKATDIMAMSGVKMEHFSKEQVQQLTQQYVGIVIDKDGLMSLAVKSNASDAMCAAQQAVTSATTAAKRQDFEERMQEIAVLTHFISAASGSHESEAYKSALSRANVLINNVDGD